MSKKFFKNGLFGIIFDCDGVMIDSEDANRHYFNSILAELGLPPMTPEQETFSFMSTAVGALHRMVPENLHGSIDEAVRKIDYARDILPRIKLMPGFRSFMEHAHAAGLPLAIDTNRTDIGIQRVLDFFSLPNYFNPVISASVATPKPSPDGVEQIARAWRTSPDTILYIGDSEDDRKAAAGAGAIFAAFGRKGLRGDFESPDFPDLAGQIAAYCPRIS